MREIAPYVVLAVLFAGCGVVMVPTNFMLGAIVGLFIGLGAARAGKGITSRLQ